MPPRATSGSARSTGPLAGHELAVLLGAGLALRLVIVLLLPGAGFGVDLDAFRFWAANLAQEGPFGFYDRGFFIDYTPGYLYVLWLLGYLGQLAGSLGDLVKIPAILADVVLAWLVHRLVVELGGSRRAALLGAAIVIVNPITWFDSAVWGQVDAVGAIPLLLGLRELWRGRSERAAVLATVAAVVKPQLGILAILVGVVVLRRSLFGTPPGTIRPVASDAEAGAGAAPAVAAGPGGILGHWRAFEAGPHGPLRIATSALAAFATATLLSVPFGLSFVGLLGRVAEAAGGYPYLTVNAYNLWALVERGGLGLAANGAWLCDAVAGDPCPPGSAILVGPVWAVFVGTALLLVALAAITALAAYRPDPRTLTIALAALAVVFFVVPTRVHERYLFPFFAVGAVLAAVSLRWRVVYAVLAVANGLNLYVVLTTLYSNPGVSDWLGIGSLVRSSGGVTAIAVAHTVAGAWIVAQLRPRARWRLAVELVRGRRAEAAGERPMEAARERPVVSPALDRAVAAVEPAPAMAPAARGGQPATPTSGPALGGRPGEVGSPAGSDVPAEPDAEPAEGSSLLGVLRRRVAARSLRPDRSRSLHGEGPGRLDRLDLWLLAVLVVAALVLRLWRLEEPYEMHFDEVYHARTATEFLQTWRYGLDHSIYEWTHPHLAKYAMALGIVVAGDDRVTATSDLGVPVRSAAIEPRWDDPSLPGARAGDRLYTATGAEVVADDLATRQRLGAIPVPGAAAVAVDPAGHRLFVGTDAGEVFVVDTAATFDVLRAGLAVDLASAAAPFAALGAPVEELLATDDGTAVVARLPGGVVVSLDGATGAELGRTTVEGATALAPAGTVDVVFARPLEVPDPSAEAATLAGLVGADVELLRRRLASTAEDLVPLAPIRDGSIRDAVQAAIDDGRLLGLTIETRPQVAVAGTSGLTILAALGAGVRTTVALESPARGLALVSGLDTPKLYVATGSDLAVVTLGEGPADTPRYESRFPMPAPVTSVRFDPSSRMVHVLGDAPDGAGRTIYVVEPHANAVYADARLPFDPAAWVVDAAPRYPAADRQAILALAADGRLALVDAGSHAFAWRLPGVLAGVLTAALLYLLARLLFARRAVAVVLGVLVVADGMLFVQSRIGMNDVYVGLFIVAAVTLFAALWLGVWRRAIAFWFGMPVVGLLLGLALASKWVAAYAIGGLGILVLARSALGRVVLLAALVVLTAVLGYLGLSVPAGATSGGNLTFLLVMIAITLAATAAAVLHPVAWSEEEVRLAVGAPAVAGIAVFLGGLALGRPTEQVALGPLALAPAAVAFALLVLSGLVWGAFVVAGRVGFGPFAGPPGPDDPRAVLPPPTPAPEGWLRPGTGFGLPLVWIGLSLVALPLGVYVASYLPWAMLDGNQIVPGWPPGHTGQTLLELTRAMYDYHNNLRATHAASSPWWAWPFDLKPVWFYQGGFAANTAAAIYDHGNLASWWLAVPAVGFATWQAFARRSLGLALVVVLFLSLWIPWARIDRATFQYHWYTILPFALLALAYFLAELWHGPSRRTWLLARAAAALAVLAPGLLWLLKAPLCWFVGVDRVYANSPACVGNPGELVVTAQVAGLVVVIGLALVVLLWQLLRLEVPGPDGRPEPVRRLLVLVATAAAALVGLLVVNAVLGETVLLAVRGFQSEILALLLCVPLGLGAWVVLGARDPRRFVVGALVVIVVVFVVVYPNVAALPLPAAVHNAYQGIVPTYIWAFQFPVNTDPAGAPPPLFALEPAILAGALGLTCLVVGYSAWVWRAALAGAATGMESGEVVAEAAHQPPPSERGGLAEGRGDR
ncbi:MAG TPA: phospholipid carrier-dependent glycosyltransferase [Candidatus Binatia bacterium]|nr:phospholipid carrier-dependent glycosyltransferase [Candidatus Binatia bacterium]